MDDGATFLVVVFFIVAALVSGAYFLNSKSNCDEAKGVLIENATGFYSCVEKGQH